MHQRLALFAAIAVAQFVPGCEATAPEDNSVAASALTGSPCSGSVVGVLRLSTRTVAAGSVLQGRVLYQNVGSQALSLSNIVIALRRPGATHADGPYDDMKPMAGAVKVAPGDTVELAGSRTFTSADLSGTWEAYPTYRDATGWHDGVTTTFTVSGGTTVFDAGAPALDSGTPPPPATPPGKAVTLSKAEFVARGGPLSDAEALARITAAAERRPENAIANATFPTDAEMPNLIKDPWDSAAAIAYQKKISGRPGRVLTTDEILQWGAHKWGVDEDVLRAVAVQESGWRQGAAGDFTSIFSNCPSNPTLQNGQCAESYGLLMMKVRYHSPSAWSLQRRSTAYVVDYVAAHYRAVMDGYVPWLTDRSSAGYPTYPNGTTDQLFWGAVGQWFSGNWYDSGALSYIDSVKTRLANRTWTTY